VDWRYKELTKGLKAKGFKKTIDTKELFKNFIDKSKRVK